MEIDKQIAELNMKTLIALMSDAYRQGLRAGQHAAAMKGNTEFEEEAVRLFTAGLSDSLSFSVFTETKEQ